VGGRVSKFEALEQIEKREIAGRIKVRAPKCYR